MWEGMYLTRAFTLSSIYIKYFDTLPQEHIACHRLHVQILRYHCHANGSEAERTCKSCHSRQNLWWWGPPHQSKKRKWVQVERCVHCLRARKNCHRSAVHSLWVSSQVKGQLSLRKLVCQWETEISLSSLEQFLSSVLLPSHKTTWKKKRNMNQDEWQELLERWQD